MIALLTMVIGNIASAFVTDFVTLATIRFCTGLIGAGTAYALSVAALSDTRDVDKNFSITIVAMVSVAIVGFLVLPPYIAELGPQAVFWSLAFIATITLPMIRSLPTKSHKSLADETNPLQVRFDARLARGSLSVCLVYGPRRCLGVC